MEIQAVVSNRDKLFGGADVVFGIDAMKSLGVKMEYLPPIMLSKFPTQKLKTLKRGKTLRIWIDKKVKGNRAGVGVVTDDPRFQYLYGPSPEADGVNAQIYAAILGLENARDNNFKDVEVISDSTAVESRLEEWLDWIKEKHEEPFRSSESLLRKLNCLTGELNVTWSKHLCNSSPEMVITYFLADVACKSKLDHMPMEQLIHKAFGVRQQGSRDWQPDHLPPTVLRTKESLRLSHGETILIPCTLDISAKLLKTLMKRNTCINNLTSGQAFGFITCLRTSDPLEHDGTVLAKCHTYDVEFKIVAEGREKWIRPTLYLPKGSVVGHAFSGSVGNDLGPEIDMRELRSVHWEGGREA